MKYRGVTIPKCNGRPQLWSRAARHSDGIFPFEAIRIIHPNGDVEWCTKNGDDFDPQGCTSDLTQEKAIRNVIDYEKRAKVIPHFLGYL